MDNQLPLHVAIPAYEGYGTRTSHRWKQEPGTIDALNLRYIWPHVGKWGIPALNPTDFEPSMLCAWHDPHGRQEAARTGGAMHFFLDDYRFERIWNKPEKHLAEPNPAPVIVIGAALTPDFSVWSYMPIATQVWQIYRARWMGAFWQYHGIEVIPTLTWGEPDTYDFVFEGVPEGGTVAIATVGSRDAEAQELYVRGLEEAVKRLSPSLLLVYGKLSKDCEWINLPRVREYPTFGDGMLARLKPDQEEEQWVDEVAQDQLDLPLPLPLGGDAEVPLASVLQPQQDDGATSPGELESSSITRYTDAQSVG